MLNLKALLSKYSPKDGLNEDDCGLFAVQLPSCATVLGGRRGPRMSTVVRCNRYSGHVGSTWLSGHVGDHV